MTTLVTIDPGEATGIALGTYTEDQPYEREKFWLVKGGVHGFVDWWNSGGYVLGSVQWVSESFILRDNDFIANIEPARIEGAMAALGIEPIYQSRTDKALAKDQVLKDHGLWVTGSMCGHTDGRDVNDATIHALARMKKIRHAPSLRKYWS